MPRIASGGGVRVVGAEELPRAARPAGCAAKKPSALLHRGIVRRRTAGDQRLDRERGRVDVDVGAGRVADEVPPTVRPAGRRGSSRRRRGRRRRTRAACASDAVERVVERGRSWRCRRRSRRRAARRGSPACRRRRVERRRVEAERRGARARWSSPPRPRSVTRRGVVVERVERRRAGAAADVQGGDRGRAPRLVLHAAPVCACSAIASDGVAASRSRGSSATSKPPSGCCWVFEPRDRGVGGRVRRRVGRARGRDRRARTRRAAVSAPHARDGTTNVRHGSSSAAPVHEGRVLATARWRRPSREHRWPGGQRQVAWLAECGGVPQSRSQLRVSVGLAPTSPVPGPRVREPHATSGLRATAVERAR